MRYKESIELANDVLDFFNEQREPFGIKYLEVGVDNSDPGFISLLNTEASKRGMDWLLALPCEKIPIERRISWTTMMINRGRYHIHQSCKNTLKEYNMIAYDEKAEDDKPKLIKMNDHTWDADMYALTRSIRNYTY